MIKVLNKYPEGIFDNIQNMLSKITVPLICKDNRKGFPKFRAMVFGLIKCRFTKEINISMHSIKYPEISEELENLGKILCPPDFEFNGIYLLKNTQSPKHKDTGNIGESMLCSFGNYKGCKIVIEGNELDASENPIIFNGAELEHWNTALESGDKYSIIYFNHKLK